jgi:hypothetical protein
LSTHHIEIGLGKGKQRFGHQLLGENVEFIRGSLTKKRGNHYWKFDNVDYGFDIDERRNPDSNQTSAGRDRFAVCKPPVFDPVLGIGKLHGFIIFPRLDKFNYCLVNTRVHPCLIKFLFDGNGGNPLKGNQRSRQLDFVYMTAMLLVACISNL